MKSILVILTGGILIGAGIDFGGVGMLIVPGICLLIIGLALGIKQLADS